LLQGSHYAVIPSEARNLVFRLLRRVVYPELDEGLLAMTFVTVLFKTIPCSLLQGY